MFHTRPNLPTYPQNRAHNKGGSETRKAIDHYSYAINDEIGRGFSSRVYKGRDENTLEPVAVKVIDMKMVKQSIHAQLLKNEINALKAFNSKNIMKLFDVFQTQNNTYIITEFCDSVKLNIICASGRSEQLLLRYKLNQFYLIQIQKYKYFQIRKLIYYKFRYKIYLK